MNTRGIAVWNLGPIILVAAAVSAGCSAGNKPRTARTPSPEASDTAMSTGDGSKQGDQAPDRAARAAMREQALILLVNTASAGGNEDRANALEALGMTPVRLASVAEPALVDPNAGVRAIGAMAVGRAKLVKFAPRLTPLVQDENAFVRIGAIYALYKCGAPIDISPLASMLMDPSPRVRAQAAFVLGELGQKSALGPLRDAARAPTGRAAPAAVRLSDLQVAEARVKLGDDSALADIRTALFPSRPEDLEAAALAIQIVGEVKDQGSVNRLIQLTAPMDESKQPMPPEIRMAAAASLAKLGQTRGSYIAREFYMAQQDTLRAQAAFLMGETKNPGNLAILTGMMNDQVGRVRVYAAAAIVKITENEGR